MTLTPSKFIFEYRDCNSWLIYVVISKADSYERNSYLTSLSRANCSTAILKRLFEVSVVLFKNLHQNSAFKKVSWI